VAVAGYTDVLGSTVSILLGDGLGSFERAADLGVGRQPRSVAVGEFNGDGAADLAVANTGANTVSILYNQASDRADVNGSNRIDGFDIAAVGRLMAIRSADAGYRRNVDVDLSEVIDGDDLAVVASRFGELRREVSPLRAMLVNPLPAIPDTITIQQAASEGDLLTVQMLVNQDSDDPAAAAEFTMNFGPDDGNPAQVLEVAGFEPGSYLSGGVGQFYIVVTSTPGRVGVSVARLPNEDRAGTGEQSLMSLFLRARREGEAQLDFEPSSSLFNAADQEVAGVRFVGGVTVEVNASGGGPPGQKIGFSPEVLDFGRVALGESSRKRLRISNFGFSDLELRDVTPTRPEFTSFFGTGCDETQPGVGCFTVPPFGFVELMVEFSPTQHGVFSADLLIESNDPRASRTHVPLVGRSGD
jgi:hypothetical protein